MNDIQKNIVEMAEFSYRHMFQQALWEAFPLETTIRAMQQSGDYDTERYLNDNPDVLRAKIDPIEHFIRHGILEGRILCKKQDCHSETSLTLDKNDALIEEILKQFDSQADEKAHSTPALLSKLDRAIYFHYASKHKMGDIVDAGVLVGGTTRALVAGTQKLAKCPVIKVFDWFKSSGAGYMYKWLKDNYNCTEEECEDFKHIFMHNCSDCLDRIEVHAGDITKLSYIQNQPLYFLGIDCCKTIDIVYPLLKTFFPALIPGNSYVVHQDYFNGWHPYIIIFMGLFNNYFEIDLDGGKISDSCVFRCVNQIPIQIIHSIFSAPKHNWYYDIHKNINVFNDCKARLLYPRSKLMVCIAQAMYLHSVGKIDLAKQTYAEAMELYSDIKINSKFKDVICGGV